MDRIWGRLWESHGSRYSWAMASVHGATTLLVSAVAALLVVRFEGADRFAEASLVAPPATAVLVYGVWLPGRSQWRALERWGADRGQDPGPALESTYAAARSLIPRAVVLYPLVGGAAAVAMGAAAGATTSHLVQYAVLGATFYASMCILGVHAFVEAALRPAREALCGTGSSGDDLPRSKPTFATWAIAIYIASTFMFGLAGAFIAAAVDWSSEEPAAAVLIGLGMTLLFGAPLNAGMSFAPSLRTIREVTRGTERVASGDYGHRLPVVQDDDLGALAASFNRMQAGLAERERLRAAFGSYVDPTLANRLLAQAGDSFNGERREVTVMFVDIRDFTPYAESHTAEETVAHLNALLEIVVPAVLEAGGHVNKYLGDGAMAVFGAPNPLAQHADAAVAVARTIQRLVDQRFAGGIRIGIGINTGQVIAGTIGGGGKLEFTLIGDTVNVAARIEALTKTTGDTILLTESTLRALTTIPDRVSDRGDHVLKGKRSAIRVHAVDPATAATL